MPTFLFELRQRSNADADRKHADDEPLNGAHAEENCTAAEEAGLPSASATWLARIGKCDAALRFPHVARPSSRRARERAMDGVDFVGAGSRELRARAMKRATIDETTELSSARHAGALECGAAAETGV